ncbi:MAG TPA: MMPL family transporter [Mycobacteriales bacterium]|nr:MMPL family transporter [Mycobacteriales bacterium]
MLARTGRFALRRRRPILLVTLLLLVLAGAVGGAVAKHLSANGGFDDPSSPSLRASAALQQLGAGAPQYVVVVTPHAGSATGGVASEAATAQGEAFTRDLRARVQAVAGPQAAASVLSYWTAGKPAALASTDGREAIVSARLSDDDDTAVKRGKEISKGLHAVAAKDGVDIVITGRAAVFGEVSTRIEHDLVTAESIAIPVTAILLILVFGSAIAALLPLAIGVLSILGSFAVLRILVSFTDVSVYATNLATSLGLGLGIDYGLFILTRYREELAAGRDQQDAIVRAVRTAGRTVLFSAVTVAAALASLMVFPLYFLRSFAYAGVAATMISAAASLVVLPALMAVLGSRLDRYDLRKPVRRLLRLGPPRPAGLGPEDGGMWHRIASFVMKRPVILGGTVVAVLLVVGAPFAKVSFGLPDDRVEPASAEAHQGADLLRNDFSSNVSEGLYVVAKGSPASNAQLTSYATALSSVAGVDHVDALTGTFAHGRLVAPPGIESRLFATPGGAWLRIAPSVEPYSKAGEQVVHKIRAVPSPFDGALLGGDSAQLVDSKHAIGGALPWAAGIIVATTLLVLFLFTGSVVLPFKAIVMTLLSLSATFGVMVWGFQRGHLAGLLGFTPTGTLDTTTPVLVFCVAFGLSMDYEVFLLSRIREEYVATGDNEHAVAWGLERTGRLVTAAGGLLALVFIAFTSSTITFIQLLGVSAALAIIIDATLVRAVLVPSFMRLMGTANWWAPAPLRRLHDKIGLSEATDDDGAVIAAGQELVNA